MKIKIYLILGLIIAIFAGVFALQNNQEVSVQFLKWAWETNVALLILTALFAGVLLSWLLSIPSVFQNFLEKIGLKSKVKKLEKKLTKTEKIKKEVEQTAKILKKDKKDIENGIEKIKA